MPPARFMTHGTLARIIQMRDTQDRVESVHISMKLMRGMIIPAIMSIVAIIVPGTGIYIILSYFFATNRRS